MNKNEKVELRELSERLIRLETTIKLEFQHLREALVETRESTRKLNEEYGKLLQKQADIETKVNESLSNWKLAAIVISPIVTTVIVLAIHFVLS